MAIVWDQCLAPGTKPYPSAVGWRLPYRVFIFNFAMDDPEHGFYLVKHFRARPNLLELPAGRDYFGRSTLYATKFPKLIFHYPYRKKHR